MAGVAEGGIAAGDMGKLFDVLLFEGAALGLHFTELFEGLQEAAGEALFVDGEVFEWVGGVAQGFGEGEGGVGFGMARLPKIPVFHVADGEEVVLGGGDAVARNWRSAQAWAS